MPIDIPPLPQVPGDPIPTPGQPITPATVLLGAVGFDDTFAKYVNDQQADSNGLGIWTDYIVNNRFEQDNHIYMMGLTNPGGGGTSILTTGTNNVGQQFTSSSTGGNVPQANEGTIINSPSPSQGTVGFVKLAFNTLLWVADWTACKEGVQPIIPDSNPADSNWVLLDVHIEPAMVTLPPNGITPIYRISGTYVYGCKDPGSFSIRNENIYGRAPWLSTTVDRRHPAQAVQSSIIN